MRTLSAVLVIAATLVSAPVANALSFTFSFDDEFPLGDVPGTVTGRIDGLADNATSAAAAVFVTSSPSLLGYPLSSSDNILSQPTVSTVNNSFTVTNGALTAENFLAVFTETNLDAIQLELISGIPQFLLVRFAHNGVNFDRIATSATFDPVPQIPLPGALPLFASGLALLGFLGRRRKRKLTR